MSTNSDINHNNKIINKLPKKIRRFLILARFDRPTGYMLLWIPTLWGLLASALNKNIIFQDIIFYIILFLIGSIVMRGAGCTWNDITDIKYDKKVARTFARPIANGDITKRQAFIFLIIQLSIGATILLFLPINSIIVAIISIIPVIIYPFMKRFTYYPQAWLGLTFNWGIWVGWFVFSNDNLIIPLLLHIAGIFWTLSYDTIYAHQDKNDDILIGVKSTALKFGNFTKLFLSIFYTIFIIIFYIVIKLLSSEIISLIPIFICIPLIIYYTYILDINNPKNCLKIFKYNTYIGLILTLSFLFN
ncbi:MAG: 4-hydroxybenzoate octaprenyltransferase [Alphaproteobacteria bacterium]